MYKAGAIPHIPVLIGVQAQVCAPLVGLYLKEAMELDFAQEAPTVAEGIRVVSPVRAQAVVEAVKASQGRFLAVGESDILPGRDELARKGFYVEATSAVVWAALSQLVQSHRHPIAPGPVVVVLTGSGLKTT
jgi:threonine synthase